jgi:Tol biopolymer transport system component/predicted Ser/Thr protein kinase
MALSPGDKLGPYEILAPIGAGGMGEVYRARDSRLGREVAIKVSNEHFSERFEQEARSIAALNHPNICQLYDVGPNYLVMELIEGSPLRGPLPLAKTVEYAGQILDALDAAHQKGITHRDLKSSNILITKQGIKLFDFGLAKQTAPLKETDVTRALTEQGAIVGTLLYMSPEQLQGEDADARSDLFSFGCVLYEMLTGKRAFDGPSKASVIAALLERDPAPLEIARPLDRVVRRSLAKDPDQRFQTARDLKAALSWAMEQPAPLAGHSSNRTSWIVAGASGMIAIVLSSLLWLLRPSGVPEQSLVRFAIYPPEKTIFAGSTIATVPVPEFAISPDGGAIVFAAAVAGNRPMLWLRTMDSLTPRPLPGTENGQDPFWSPDGRWVGFFADGKLQKTSVAGGAAQVVAQGLPDSFGGSWAPDDTILFGTGINPIFRVASTGGPVTPVTTLDTLETNRWPQILPDGHRFLYVRSAQGEQSGVYAGDLNGKTKKFLVNSESNGIYAPPGYLLWVNGDALFGQAFNPIRLELHGQPFTVAERVGRSTAFQSAVSASLSGALAYAGAVARIGTLTWFDRSGNPLGTVGQTGDYVDFRLAPDEKRLAASLGDPKSNNPDIWLTDLVPGRTSRFTFGPGLNAAAVWSPDGTRLVFRKIAGGLIEFYQRSASGGGDEAPLMSTSLALAAGMKAINFVPTDWSPDGRNIIFEVPTVASGYDLWLLPLTGGRKPVQFLASQGDQIHANFSPDGRLVAYASSESGRFEIYVQTFPLSDLKWQVSTAGGYEPRWRADGHEIYYLSEDRRLMAVAVGTGPSFDVPKPLFQTRVPAVVHANRTNYVASRDGRRFLVNTQTADAPPNPITLMLNWSRVIPPSSR